MVGVAVLRCLEKPVKRDRLIRAEILDELTINVFTFIHVVWMKEDQQKL